MSFSPNMGSKLWKKLRKLLTFNSKLNCFARISMKKKFVNYESIEFLAEKGDILELLYCQSISHYVLLTDRQEPDQHYWCLHVQRMAQNNGYGVVKYEPLINVLKDVFQESTPVYRIRNQKKLSEKVLRLTQNSTPDLSEVLTILKQFNDFVVKYEENSCNCEHYVTLWKYGIGWSHAINCRKSILKTIELFRKSFAKNIFDDSCIALSNETVSNVDCNVIIYCFGLYGRKLLDSIHYVMKRQMTLIKV